MRNGNDGYDTMHFSAWISTRIAATVVLFSQRNRMILTCYCIINNIYGYDLLTPKHISRYVRIHRSNATNFILEIYVRTLGLTLHSGIVICFCVQTIYPTTKYNSIAIDQEQITF